jgi:hypothetical protein
MSGVVPQLPPRVARSHDPATFEPNMTYVHLRLLQMHFSAIEGFRNFALHEGQRAGRALRGAHQHSQSAGRFSSGVRHACRRALGDRRRATAAARDRVYDLLGAGKRDINDPIHQIAQIGGFPFAHGLFKGRLRAPPCSQGSAMRPISLPCDGNDVFPPVILADRNFDETITQQRPQVPMVARSDSAVPSCALCCVVSDQAHCRSGVAKIVFMVRSFIGPGWSAPKTEAASLTI